MRIIDADDDFVGNFSWTLPPELELLLVNTTGEEEKVVEGALRRIVIGQLALLVTALKSSQAVPALDIILEKGGEAISQIARLTAKKSN